MGVSKMPSRGKPELCVVSIRVPGVELGEAVSSVWPRAHEGSKSKRFGCNAGKNIKGMGGDNIREVGDYSNAIPGIRSLI
jgi:hypothetical protein